MALPTVSRPILQAVFLAVFGVGAIAALMSIEGPIPWADPRFADYDHNSYLAMARDGIGAPGRASTPPYCWRVLTPWLVRMIPLPLPAGFFLVSFTALVGSALGIYILCRGAGLSHAWSLAGEVSFLSFFWAAGFNTWNYLMVDAMSLLIVITGLAVVESRRGHPRTRQVAVGAIMMLGALNKESYLVLAAAALVFWWREERGGPAKRLVAAVAPVVPAVVVSILVRMAITADPAAMKEFPSYSLSTVLGSMVAARLATLPRWMAEALVDPWGPLVIVPLILGPLAALRWGAKHPHRLALLAVALAQTFFGTSVGRLVIAAAPVACLFAMESLRDLVAARRSGHGTVTLLFGFQFLFQYLRRTTLGFSIPPYEPSLVVTIAQAARGLAFGLFAILWIMAARRPWQTPSRAGGA